MLWAAPIKLPSNRTELDIFKEMGFLQNVYDQIINTQFFVFIDSIHQLKHIQVDDNLIKTFRIREPGSRGCFVGLQPHILYLE